LSDVSHDGGVLAARAAAVRNASSVSAQCQLSFARHAQSHASPLAASAALHGFPP
jgi:hypothetical protein